GQGITFGPLPIEAEPALQRLLPVVGVAARSIDQSPAFEVPGIEAIEELIADLPAVAGAAESLFFGTAARRDQSSQRLPGGFRDDVDDAVDSIGAPECAAGAANDLDPLDLLDRQVLGFPVDAAGVRRVDAPPVDQDQQPVGKAPAISAGA